MKKLVLMSLLIAQSSLQAQYSSSRLSIGASGQLNAGGYTYTTPQLGYGAALRVDWRIVKNLHLLTSVGFQHLRQKWNGLFFGNQVDPQTGVILANTSFTTNALYLPIELAYTFPIGNSLAIYPTIGANLKSEMRDKEWGGAILFGAGINKNLNENGSLFAEIKTGGNRNIEYRVASLSVGYVYKIK